MAEDPPSQEILKQLGERLDLLDHVLGTITARLHLIEQHLGIVRQQQPLHDPLAGESGKTHPSTSQVKTQESKIPEATQPKQSAPQAREQRALIVTLMGIYTKELYKIKAFWQKIVIDCHCQYAIIIPIS